MPEDDFMQAMLEVLPPMRKSTAESRESYASRIAREISSIPGLGWINIPEIADENYAGAPLYRHIDVCDFASMLKGRISAGITVNKAVVYMESEHAFASWLKRAVKSEGLRRFVFVGGAGSSAGYNGPSVTTANSIASGLGGLEIGNICIPSREGEAERLASKTGSGASFFTTQLLFEPSATKRVLSDYAAACRKAGLKPATFFLSFAPASSQFDIDFFKWLGAVMPPAVESRLMKSGDMASESGDVALEAFLDIKSFAEKKDIGIEASVNVEMISGSNLGHACRLLRSMLASTG